MYVLLTQPEPVLADLSSSDLAQAALEHAKELLQVLGPPARQPTAVPSEPAAPALPQ